jgi:hypothetical protein
MLELVDFLVKNLAVEAVLSAENEVDEKFDMIAAEAVKETCFKFVKTAPLSVYCVRG